ncbi:oxygen-independent coproporphyrinogen-3 oxidase [Nonlabens dokdonensis]|jgi:oxygen-independent coproporphyrinogen-3 oxidase|uniref:Coproporphyrinogen-III oxidase n=2 Tax=Nonlabens dokdonensis TaxID=328515 RepID=L7W596_NONDD|nr:oxygen-independent coproporphyrinogen III oxidase [Nonlabens dokdonensis]AGC75332.1 oxygen-independent coproporphyrinogen III oxidase [Nonlabens dokdonensis DSW-6]PZX43040.1 oxygen-independent coproporphyrinogen-3 oxidase [Nonlabens dokdonensis]
MCDSLISKYNVAGPRYTSYPTVPYWDQDSFSVSSWKDSLQKSFKESNSKEGISLYIHLPFCESMCTFCGCNKRITKNHKVEVPYLESVIKELRLYVALFSDKPRIKQIHLGGGTPTFFSSSNLEYLINEIFKLADRAENVEFSFEGHPNNTTLEHLETLHQLGFNRVCYGVQDYNLSVQIAINRVQPFEKVQAATNNARKAGYTSVGHDIIYGLPFQTIDNVIHTIERTIELLPDRIAFYSYAHVPWIKGNGQRGFKDEDLPTAAVKRQQYEIGKKLLDEAGYVEIGMDHYALKTDSLYQAQQNGTIHRNFMGYNSSNTQVMIGLGVSSISDSWYSFAQNVKNIDEYQSLVEKSELPVYRGHLLTEEDLIIRKHILNLMCRFETSWQDDDLYFNELPDVLLSLIELEKDELIEIKSNQLLVTEKGRPYVRNVCLPFDLRLQRNKPETQLFSMTV